jgi:hypothetical protein
VGLLGFCIASPHYAAIDDCCDLRRSVDVDFLEDPNELVSKLQNRETLRRRIIDAAQRIPALDNYTLRLELCLGFNSCNIASCSYDCTRGAVAIFCRSALPIGETD